MNYYTRDITTTQKMLYSRNVDFSNFSTITDEKFKEIEERVKRRFYTRENSSRGLSKYIEAIEYLTNPTISRELHNFNEKILYLILACDKDLITYKEYKKAGIPLLKEIRTIEDDKEKETMLKIREQKQEIFENTVRRQLGFFDPYIKKYEAIFNAVYNKKRDLDSNISINAIKKISLLMSEIEDFNDITDEEFKRLSDVSAYWQSIAENPTDYNTLAYNVINQPSLLNIKRIKEAIIVFLIVYDIDFDVLRIYEEESNMKNLKERVLQEKGYYNKEFIKIEKKFKERFYPDLILSEWTK